MLLTMRQGYRVYEISAPVGSRVERDATREWLVIRGVDPAETWVVLPRERVLAAASAGLFGLSIRSRPVEASLS
jgi:hypothetical protein